MPNLPQGYGDHKHWHAMLCFFLIAFSFIPFGFAGSQSTQGDPLKRHISSSQPTPSPSSDYILLPTLSPSAKQADYGAEVWRLVCQDCHGDKGQGLTSEWRATWAPQDQNCWQSKCHATNHPPDGFELPVSVPVAIGTQALARFETALELYRYIRQYMPYQDPGALSDEKAWMVTAYLLRENQIDPVEVPLDVSRATSLYLHPESAAPIPTAAANSPPIVAKLDPTRVTTQTDAREESLSTPWSFLSIPLVLGVLAVIALIALRLRR